MAKQEAEANNNRIQSTVGTIDASERQARQEALSGIMEKVDEALAMPETWRLAMPELKALLGQKLMLGNREIDIIRKADINDKNSVRFTHTAGYLKNKPSQLYRFIQVIKSPFIATSFQVGQWDVSVEYNIKAKLRTGEAKKTASRVSEAVEL